MGTYLINGIVHDIFIEKKQIKTKRLAIDKVIDQLGKEVNINLYNFNTDRDNYLWRVKPEIFDSKLVAFLDDQFRMYCDEKDLHMQETIKELGNIKTSNEIIELAKSKQLVHFQWVDSIIEHMKVPQENGFDTDVSVNYCLISYFLDGKIIMECYENILKYFERNVRLQRKKYPIVDCIKVMITN